MLMVESWNHHLKVLASRKFRWNLLSNFIQQPSCTQRKTVQHNIIQRGGIFCFNRHPLKIIFISKLTAEMIIQQQLACCQNTMAGWHAARKLTIFHIIPLEIVSSMPTRSINTLWLAKQSYKYSRGMPISRINNLEACQLTVLILQRHVSMSILQRHTNYQYQYSRGISIIVMLLKNNSVLVNCRQYIKSRKLAYC